jgi:hypothetical protein
MRSIPESGFRSASIRAYVLTIERARLPRLSMHGLRFSKRDLKGYVAVVSKSFSRVLNSIGSRVSLSVLPREAMRVERVAGKGYTTLEAINEMRKSRRVQAREFGYNVKPRYRHGKLIAQAAGIIKDGERHTGLPRPLVKRAGMFRWLKRWLTRERSTIRRKNLMIFGRSGRIRTCDPCVPNQVIVPHRTEQSAVFASLDDDYFRSFSL